jgi:hypothetical protein
MRKLLPFVLLSLCAASQAQTFTTVSYNDTLGSTATFSSSGTTYRAMISGFNLNASSTIGDIAWIYNFDSAPVAPFTAVTIRVSGTLTGGSIRIAGNEKVFDTSGTTPVQVANGLIDETAVADASGLFSITETFNFSQPVTLGQAQKDLLHILLGPGAQASVTMIEQTFTPVPEPASLAALGIGVAALARRRRARKQ